LGGYLAKSTSEHPYFIISGLLFAEIHAPVAAYIPDRACSPKTQALLAEAIPVKCFMKI
jgi:hypothetical protein